MKIKILALICVCSQYIQAQNVLISNQHLPNEPSIKLDPNDPSKIIAGANLNNYYTSSDTGKTWIENTLTSSFGVWGDPVIEVDTTGNFYFFHLSNPSSGSWIDRIVCQKTNNHGLTWSDGSFVGLNNSKAQDKEWSVVDRQNNNIYLTWTEFDNYGSNNPSDSSRILFSRSLDGGLNWIPAKKINKVNGDCVDSDNTVEGATPAVGPNGEVYVAWTGPRGIVFNRSLDFGDSWLAEPILVDSFAHDWDFDIPGLDRCNGLPVLKCDLSGGENHGTLYINWTDQRNGVNNTDVWLAKSLDGGDTWTTPIKVNDDNSNRHQFLSWMDVDQSNGVLHFVYYDRRNFNDNRTNVFLASSEDGGDTFSNRIISESPFEPYTGIFFGDYTNITAHNNVVRPIWTRLENGDLSIWTDITPFKQEEDSTTTAVKNELMDEVNLYPNPVTDVSFVSFKLRGTSEVSIIIFDLTGNKIHTVWDRLTKGYGKYIVPISTADLQLSAGTYPCVLTINGVSKNIHPIVVR